MGVPAADRICRRYRPSRSPLSRRHCSPPLPEPPSSRLSATAVAGGVLQAQGNRLVYNGEQVRLRGVAVGDPLLAPSARSATTRSLPIAGVPPASASIRPPQPRGGPAGWGLTQAGLDLLTQAGGQLVPAGRAHLRAKPSDLDQLAGATLTSSKMLLHRLVPGPLELAVGKGVQQLAHLVTGHGRRPPVDRRSAAGCAAALLPAPGATSPCPWARPTTAAISR